MRRTRQLLRAPLALACAAVLALLAGILVSACEAAATTPAKAGPAAIRVSATPVGQPVPAGFLGISMEYRGLEAYAGTNPAAVDPPFVALLHNLAPSDFVLRIGGDSSDWTWWPVAHVAQPGGVRYSLTPAWAAVTRSLATALDGHLILGVNFEADSRVVAAGMANSLVSHVGRSLISALELGNEPELYSGFSWYKTASGQPVYGRPRNYDPQQYISDYANIAAGLPSVPLAGPSSGSADWLGSLGAFAGHEKGLGLITVHAYPLKHCTKTEVSTAADFFDDASLQGLADQIGGWAATAHAHHLTLRVDEMNSISCGGQNGLSQSFAPALWALDVLPRLVRAGADGVNFDTIPNTWQSLISATDTGGVWQVAVQPEFYGLMTFAAAAPAGSRLLKLSVPSAPGLDAWAARTASGHVNVVLINSSRRPLTTTITVAGGTGAAVLARLAAPGIGATSGVTLGGKSIAASTGQLAGTSTATTVAPARGGYTVSLPGASAAVLVTGSGATYP